MALTDLPTLGPSETGRCLREIQSRTVNRECFPEYWQILDKDYVQDRNWIVALVRGMWTATRRLVFLQWMRRALEGVETQLWGVQWPEPDTALKIELNNESMVEFDSGTDIDGGTVLGPEGNFWRARDHNGWDLIAGPRRVVQETINSSLRTQWEQFYLHAEWGDPSERASEHRKELMRYYAPCTGLEETTISEPVKNRNFRAAASRVSSRNSVERRRIRTPLQGKNVFDASFLLEKQWVVTGQGAHSVESRWQGFLTEAEWLAKATSGYGDEQLTAVSIDDLGTAYEFPATRDGWLAIESLLGEGHYLIYPHHENYCILGSRLKYFLIAGEPDFVSEAVGSVSIEYNNEEFFEWMESVRDYRWADELYEYIREHRATYGDIRHWLQTTWGEIRDQGYFEDPWPHPICE